MNAKQRLRKRKALMFGDDRVEAEPLRVLEMDHVKGMAEQPLKYVIGAGDAGEITDGNSAGPRGQLLPDNPARRAQTHPGNGSGYRVGHAIFAH